jgi:hypothetical protein
MVREQDVFFVAGPAVDFALDTWRTRGPLLRARLSTAAIGAGAFIVGWTPQLLAYMTLNGRPGPSQYVTRKMSWHSPHALQVLFDPNHGFFVWTPLALIGLAGLMLVAARGASTLRTRLRASGASARQAPPHPPSRLWRFGEASPAAPRLAALLLLMVALQVYVSGAIESWTVAGAFGQRRFVGITIILIVGLSALWQAAAPRTGRRAATLVVLLAVWWNLGLIALFGTRMMDRQRVEPRRNAYDVFVTLPRMAPGLAWRYVTARDSFYDAPPRALQEPR